MAIEGQERTEQPTPKRLQDAREKGQVPRSRELNTTMVMLVAAAALLFMGESMLGGLAGSLSDSLLGATVQGIYYSPSREKETEKRFEADGSQNQHLRGWRWLGNDWVNLFSSLVGAGVAAASWRLLCGFV